MLEKISHINDISQNDAIESLKNCFHIKGGNSGLTKDFIYNNQPNTENEKISIFSGATLDENSMGFVSDKARPDNKKLKIYYAPAILVIRKGKAGEMVYIERGKIAINDDAYVLVLKDDWMNRINMRWFVYQYQELFYNLVTSKSDNATFNKTYAEIQQILIPKMSEQLNLVDRLIYLEKKSAQYSNVISCLKSISTDNVMNIDGEHAILKNCFHIKGGNSGLTEDFIYNNQPNTEDEKVSIFSSATKKSNLMGYISMSAMPDGKKLKTFKGECILISRNGYAGNMMYMNGSVFTTNDHAYVLVPKDDWVDRISMRWFVYQYQELFYNLITSKSDNATFNKTYAERQNIIIPDKGFQDRIAENLLVIDSSIEKLEKICEQIDELMMCEIIN